MVQEINMLAEATDKLVKDVGDGAAQIVHDIHDLFDHVARHGCGLGMNDEGIAGLVQTLKELGPNRWVNPTYRPEMG